MISEIRMFIIELLIDLQLMILPLNHKHAPIFLKHIKNYLDEVNNDK